MMNRGTHHCSTRQRLWPLHQRALNGVTKPTAPNVTCRRITAQVARTRRRSRYAVGLMESFCTSFLSRDSLWFCRCPRDRQEKTWTFECPIAPQLGSLLNRDIRDVERLRLWFRLRELGRASLLKDWPPSSFLPNMGHTWTPNCPTYFLPIPKPKVVISSPLGSWYTRKPNSGMMANR